MMIGNRKESGSDAPETSEDGGATRGGRPPSKRVARRLAQAAGLLADAIIMAARPDAPRLEIERAVAERCRRARLPVPSRPSLTARIAFVRRHGTRETAAFAHQITIDHGVLVDPERGCATLSVAVLEPPGIVLAWRLAGRAPDAATTAALLARVLADACEDGEPARISARFDTDDGHAILDETLERARVTRVGGSSARPVIGRTVRRLLGLRVGRARVGSRVPDARFWMAREALEGMATEIERKIGRRADARTRKRPFTLTDPRAARELAMALDALTPG